MLSPETYRAIVSGQRQDPLAALARCGLRILEPAYRAGVSIRNRRFDCGHAAVHQIPVPVISVGNLTLGGTGKTPMVAWLADWFQQHGVTVGLVSRGYRSSDGQANDEARELSRRLPDVPHVQAPDRVAATQQLLRQSPVRLIVLDDAFQHRRIGRDLDIVLIDATNPFGFEHVFPRGMLREPPSALRRADVVLLTRSNLIDAATRASLQHRVRHLAPQAAWVEVGQRAGCLVDIVNQPVPDDQVPQGDVLAFCGIGNPDGFQRLVESWQQNRGSGRLRQLRAFPDHFAYPDDAVADLDRWAAAHRSEVSAVLCTAKDLVKLTADRLPTGRLGGLPLLALQVELEFRSPVAVLETKLRRLAAQATGSESTGSESTGPE